MTIQIGCDNTCAFCIVPAVRGPEISRPFGDVVAEVERAAADGVTEVTLLGQNVNSYGRDLTLRLRGDGSGPGTDAGGSARATVLPPEFLAGPAWVAEGAVRARPLFADLLRAVGRRPRHPTGPLHQPAPQGPAPRDHRRHGRTCPRCASTCTCPLQSGSDAVLAAMHRGYTAERYLERLAAARAGIDDLAVTHRHHRRLPRRDRAPTSTPPSRWRPRPEYDNAFTFVYSPRPGTEAADR